MPWVVELVAKLLINLDLNVVVLQHTLRMRRDKALMLLRGYLAVQQKQKRHLCRLVSGLNLRLNNNQISV